MGDDVIFIRGFRQAGKYDVLWDSKGLPSGIYLYRLETDEFAEVRKMIFQR